VGDIVEEEDVGGDVLSGETAPAFGDEGADVGELGDC
jgi:hypothetical protein